MDYTVTIRFDDDAHSLSASNGLSIEALGELLVSLSKAVGLKKEDRVTLSRIKGNCYALDFTTANELHYRSIETIHKKISENDFCGFNSDQKRYASKLVSIVRERGYRINVYNPDKGFDYKIMDVSFKNSVESYYEIDDVYGIIASIGSSSLHAQPAIKLSKEGYDIRITNAQESKLIKHFKKDRLLLTIKKKINAETNKIESVSLIDFEVTGSDSDTFSERACRLMKKYEKRGLFSKVKDTSLSVRNLRGNVNLKQLEANEE
jgi:hypothetical protein